MIDLNIRCSRLVCLWEGNYFFCSNYDSRHVCQISLANSQYSASNEPLNIWPDSLLFELWRADSDHVMCNMIILFDVKSITSLTADPTAHVRVVYNSDWIWWIKSIKCRLLLILEEEIIPDNQNENSRVSKLWNDQVPKTKDCIQARLNTLVGWGLEMFMKVLGLVSYMEKMISDPSEPTFVIRDAFKK